MLVCIHIYTYIYMSAYIQTMHKYIHSHLHICMHIEALMSTVYIPTHKHSYINASTHMYMYNICMYIHVSQDEWYLVDLRDISSFSYV